MIQLTACGLFSFGIIFIGLSIFDKSTPRGGLRPAMSMYRARGGLVSFLLLLLWILFGSYFLSTLGTIALNATLVVAILIGAMLGYFLWKLFIYYNRNIRMGF